jgi:predicted small secreted protein
MMRKVTAILLGVALMGLSACNTVQGVGKDIESVGKKGEQVLDKERGK